MTRSLVNIAGLVNVALPPQSGKIGALFHDELIAGSSPSAVTQIVLRLASSPTSFHRPKGTVGTTGAIAHDGSYLCGDGRGHYCRAQLETLSVHEGADIDVEICCDGFSAAALLEWIVLPMAFFPLARAGICPLHASGVGCSDGPNVVFAAWAGVGKTNLLLRKLTSDARSVYLGDDSVLVSSSGDALPSSRTISLYGYNAEVAPPLPLREMVRMDLGHRLRRAGEGRRGRFAQLAVYGGSVVSNTRLALRRVDRSEQVVPRPIDIHFICRTILAKRVGSSAKVGPRHDCVDSHIAVLDYEHVNFRRHLQGMQWVQPGTADPWDDLRIAWRGILSRYFAHVQNVRVLELPKDQTPAHIDEAWRLIQRLA